MQTTYRQNLAKAIKGMSLVAPRRSRPRQLALLPQIGTFVLTNSSEAGTLVLRVTDSKTSQTYDLTVTISGATEATSLDEIVAAAQANAKINSLFTFTDDNTLTVTYTARHANRAYVWSVVSAPGSMSVTPTAISQVAGGSGLEFGQLVARGTGDDEFSAMTASTTVAQIAGMLFRTDANHFHSLENDTPSAVDACRRGVHMPIAEEWEGWVEVEEAVTPASRPHVRVEANASYGVGSWGDTPQGTAQVSTLTVVADQQVYAVKALITVAGQDIPLEFEYAPTDGTTTTDVAIDGLEPAAAAAILAQGLTGIVAASAASASATMTLTLGTGYTWKIAPFFSSFNDDTAVVSGTVSAGTPDADMLDVGSIARYTSTAAAGELASIRLRLQP